MLMDKDVRLCTADTTGNIGTNLLGDVINAEVARDLGAGRPVYLTALVETAIAATAGGTYQLLLSSGTDVTLSGAVNHITTDAFDAAAGIAAGTVLINQALPAEGSVAYKQYLAIREVVAVANTSAGAIDAFLTLDQRAYKAYDQGVV